MLKYSINKIWFKVKYNQNKLLIIVMSRIGDMIDMIFFLFFSMVKIADVSEIC